MFWKVKCFTLLNVFWAKHLLEKSYKKILGKYWNFDRNFEGVWTLSFDYDRGRRTAFSNVSKVAFRLSGLAGLTSQFLNETHEFSELVLTRMTLSTYQSRKKCTRTPETF